MKGDLGMLTDTLNEVLERCEKAFRAHRWGVVASVDLEDGWILSFRKAPSTRDQNTMWQLCTSSPDHPLPWELLFTAPRHVRVNAARSMPALYTALQEEVRCQEEGIRTVIEELEAFVETVEAGTR